jgi:hypothetical protein
MNDPKSIIQGGDPAPKLNVPPVATSRQLTEALEETRGENAPVPATA